MTITGFIGRLFRFRPSLFLINGLLWCIFHSLPLLIGLGMQWFLTGRRPVPRIMYGWRCP